MPAGVRIRHFFRRLGPAGPLALIAGSLPVIGGFVLLSLVSYVAPWLRSHQEYGVLFYVLGFSLLAGLALLPTYAQSLVGGFAFGFWLGWPAALCGFLGASALAYAIARRASGDHVIDLINEHPKWKAVYASLVASGFGRTLLIVTLVRLPPNSPFAMTNLAMAATKVRPVAYLLGTLLGMAPRTGVAVFLGAGLSELSFSNKPSTWIMLAGMAVTVAVIIIIGMLANQAIARMTGLPSHDIRPSAAPAPAGAACDSRAGPILEAPVARPPGLHEV
jgi:uncharacterized membrane protein YdjX (TVP38/TMEM64 family)